MVDTMSSFITGVIRNIPGSSQIIQTVKSLPFGREAVSHVKGVLSNSHQIESTLRDTVSTALNRVNPDRPNDGLIKYRDSKRTTSDFEPIPKAYADSPRSVSYKSSEERIGTDLITNSISSFVDQAAQAVGRFGAGAQRNIESYNVFQDRTNLSVGDKSIVENVFDRLLVGDFSGAGQSIYDRAVTDPFGTAGEIASDVGLSWGTMGAAKAVKGVALGARASSVIRYASDGKKIGGVVYFGGKKLPEDFTRTINQPLSLSSFNKIKFVELGEKYNDLQLPKKMTGKLTAFLDDGKIARVKISKGKKDVVKIINPRVTNLYNLGERIELRALELGVKLRAGTSNKIARILINSISVSGSAVRGGAYFAEKGDDIVKKANEVINKADFLVQLELMSPGSVIVPTPGGGTKNANAFWRSVHGEKWESIITAAEAKRGGKSVIGDSPNQIYEEASDGITRSITADTGAVRNPKMKMPSDDDLSAISAQELKELMFGGRKNGINPQIESMEIVNQMWAGKTSDFPFLTSVVGSFRTQEQLSDIKKIDVEFSLGGAGRVIKSNLIPDPSNQITFNSGGQTGVDQLIVLLEDKYNLGGWIPLGKKTTKGTIPEELMKKVRWKETNSPDYFERTKRNVDENDVTIIWGDINKEHGGSAATFKYASLKGKEVLLNPTTVKEVTDFIEKNNARSINIAGDRNVGSKYYQDAERILKGLKEAKTISTKKTNKIRIILNEDIKDVKTENLDDILQISSPSNKFDLVAKSLAGKFTVPFNIMTPDDIQEGGINSDKFIHLMTKFFSKDSWMAQKSPLSVISSGKNKNEQNALAIASKSVYYTPDGLRNIGATMLFLSEAPSTSTKVSSPMDRIARGYMAKQQHLEKLQELQKSDSYMYFSKDQNIDLDNIPDGVVVIIGTNLQGRQGKGMALSAVKAGILAEGKGKGLDDLAPDPGKAYALPTRYFSSEGKILTRNLDDIKTDVDDFLKYARANPTKIFLVPEVGTGLAKIPVKDMAPMFKNSPKNVILPERFKDELIRLYPQVTVFDESTRSLSRVDRKFQKIDLSNIINPSSPSSPSSLSTINYSMVGSGHSVTVGSISGFIEKIERVGDDWFVDTFSSAGAKREKLTPEVFKKIISKLGTDKEFIIKTKKGTKTYRGGGGLGSIFDNEDKFGKASTGIFGSGYTPPSKQILSQQEEFLSQEKKDIAENIEKTQALLYGREGIELKSVSAGLAKLLGFNKKNTLDSVDSVPYLESMILSYDDTLKRLNDSAKLQKFMGVLRSLGGNTKHVEKKFFVEELNKTGQFTGEEASKFIQKMLRESLIYEPKSDHYMSTMAPNPLSLAETNKLNELRNRLSYYEKKESELTEGLRQLTELNKSTKGKTTFTTEKLQKDLKIVSDEKNLIKTKIETEINNTENKSKELEVEIKRIMDEKRVTLKKLTDAKKRSKKPLSQTFQNLDTNQSSSEIIKSEFFKEKGWSVFINKDKEISAVLRHTKKGEQPARIQEFTIRVNDLSDYMWASKNPRQLLENPLLQLDENLKGVIDPSTNQGKLFMNMDDEQLLTVIRYFSGKPGKRQEKDYEKIRELKIQKSIANVNSFITKFLSVDKKTKEELNEELGLDMTYKGILNILKTKNEMTKLKNILETEEIVITDKFGKKATIQLDEDKLNVIRKILSLDPRNNKKSSKWSGSGLRAKGKELGGSELPLLSFLHGVDVAIDSPVKSLLETAMDQQTLKSFPVQELSRTAESWGFGNMPNIMFGGKRLPGKGDKPTEVIEREYFQRLDNIWADRMPRKTYSTSIHKFMPLGSEVLMSGNNMLGKTWAKAVEQDYAKRMLLLQIAERSKLTSIGTPAPVFSSGDRLAFFKMTKGKGENRRLKDIGTSSDFSKEGIIKEFKESEQSIPEMTYKNVQMDKNMEKLIEKVMDVARPTGTYYQDVSYTADVWGQKDTQNFVRNMAETWSSKNPEKVWSFNNPFNNPKKSKKSKS